VFVRGYMSCLLEGTCHVCVVCGCLCILVSNTYCVFGVVFLLLVCPILPVSLDCPFVLSPSVFSNVYLKQLVHAWVVQYKIMRQIPFLSVLPKGQHAFVFITIHCE
jgi:hypothetical protein